MKTIDANHILVRDEIKKLESEVIANLALNLFNEIRMKTRVSNLSLWCDYNFYRFEITAHCKVYMKFWVYDNKPTFRIYLYDRVHSCWKNDPDFIFLDPNDPKMIDEIVNIFVTSTQKKGDRRGSLHQA